MKNLPTGAAMVAGVAGHPIHHSLSPFLHTAWLRDLGLNGVYAPFSPPDDHGFERLLLSCRSNGVKGLNVTAPFKEQALALADDCAEPTRRCGSANLLTFDSDGRIFAATTDGHGLLRAFGLQAPDCDLGSGPVAIIGAGGAARAAAAALLAHGCPQVRVVNRTLARAEDLVFAMGGGATAFDIHDLGRAFTGCVAVINAASGGPLPLFDALPDHATVMDMSYRPLRTNWLRAAEARGLKTVDGLDMLIEQARPSFEAFYGAAPNPAFDVRGLALKYLGEKP